MLFNLLTLSLVGCLVSSTFSATLYNGPSKVKYPVILVPGDGGSQLQAKLTNKPHNPHLFCERNTKDFFDIWINLELFAPYFDECVIDNLRLHYNKTSRETHDTPGVTIRVPGFGDTRTVEWLDTNKYSPTKYYATMAEELVKVGYERGQSLRGAPYDFRKSANEQDVFFKKYKAMIEDMYSTNDNMPVILVCHSMGNIMTLYFLNNYVDAAWKAKYIKSFVAISSPFAGAAKSMRMMASGDNLHIITVKGTTVRPLQRSMTSTTWLLPRKDFWQDNEVLVQTPKRNYTANDYPAFFRDIGFEEGPFIHQDTKALLEDLTPPGVELHCLNGISVKTPDHFIYYDNSFPNQSPRTIDGDGDGSVNLRSLLACTKFRGRQSQPVYHRSYNGAVHVDALWNEDIVKYVVGQATGTVTPSDAVI